MVNVRFVELAPPRSIVEAVNFVTTDPAYFGEMTLTAAFEEVLGGTEVTLVFKNLPPGLRAGTTRRAREPGAAGAASNDRMRIRERFGVRSPRAPQEPPIMCNSRYSIQQLPALRSLASCSQAHLFACFHLVQQFAQVGLRLNQIDRDHDPLTI
jgi:hypothetical protein